MTTLLGKKIARTGNEEVIAWLRRPRSGRMALGGIGTGSYLLACAGLLNDCRATIHWWDLDSLREEFPQTRMTNNLFELDNKRYTCSGGTAAMDMMLSLIGQFHGMKLAAISGVNGVFTDEDINKVRNLAIEARKKSKPAKKK